MIYISIIILLIIIFLIILFFWHQIELVKRRKLSEINLKYARDIEYIIRVIKSCINYKQLVSLNKWWHTYLKNSNMFAIDYFKTVEDRNRIEQVFQNKLFEIQNPNKLTTNQLKKLQELVINRKSYIREGQSYFNELYKINFKLADSIRGTEYDPFYDDSRIDKFLNKISE